MSHNIIRIAACCLMLTSSTLAWSKEPALKDLGPQKTDHAQAQAQARIDEANMKRIYSEQQAKSRVKSAAEVEIDKIPEATTLRPTYPPGVKLTVPLK
jgi:hypothetical protein